MSEGIATSMPSVMASQVGTPGCSCGGSCQNCSSQQSVLQDAKSYCYAVGRIRPRFPNMGVEKELAQVIGAGALKEKLDPALLKKAFSDPRAQYIARQMCWVLSVETFDLLIVQPASATELGWLLETLRDETVTRSYDVVIGYLGPRAPMAVCNGALLPTTSPAQLYTFSADAFARQVPRPAGIDEAKYTSLVTTATMSVLGSLRNAGASDGQRALNYLATRSAELYSLTIQALQEDLVLAGVRSDYSEFSSGRRVMECLFTFKSRRTPVEQQYSALVDVTDLFPFLVTPLGPHIFRR